MSHFGRLSGQGVSWVFAGITPSFFWLAKICLAQLVPALVEQVHVADLLDPLRRRVMRRMRAAGDVIEEERLVRRGGIQPLHVPDRLVRHVGGQVVIRLPDPRIDLGMIAEEIGRPLVGFAAHEPIEVLEAHPAGPLIERAGQAVLIGRRVVVLAEPRGRVAVVPENRADGGLVLGDDAVVARISRGHFGDHAEAHRVVVAAGDERRARRRAERGGVELRVAQARLRDAIHGRRRDDAAKGAADAVALIVGHDQQHVGRALGRHDGRRPAGFGVRGVER